MALREAMVVSFTLFEFPCDMPKSSKGVIGMLERWFQETSKSECVKCHSFVFDMVCLTA